MSPAWVGSFLTYLLLLQSTASCTSFSCAVTGDNSFSQVLAELANEVLGVQKFQDYLDRLPEQSSNSLNGENLVRVDYLDGLPEQSSNSLNGENLVRVKEVREGISLTHKLEEFWKSFSDPSHFIYAMYNYIGTKVGLFRTFSGTLTAKEYDATRRPWYTTAVGAGQIGKVTISRPYNDSSGGILLTLCQTIYEGRENLNIYHSTINRETHSRSPAPPGRTCRHPTNDSSSPSLGSNWSDDHIGSELHPVPALYQSASTLLKWSEVLDARSRILETANELTSTVNNAVEGSPMERDEQASEPLFDSGYIHSPRWSRILNNNDMKDTDSDIYHHPTIRVQPMVPIEENEE